MLNTSVIVILIISFFASVTFNGFFRNLAKNYNVLIDIPDKSRKFHFRATPLTGGISIYVAALVSALLLASLTSVSFEANISERGLMKELGPNETNISRSYEVNEKNYELEIEKNNTENTVSINLNGSNKENTTVKVVQNNDGYFEVILPTGETQTYKYDNGSVTLVSEVESQPIIPKLLNTPRINIDTTTLSMLICGALIILVMTFDDLFEIRASIRIILQACVATLMVILSDETITNLGNLLGEGDIILPIIWSEVFTIFCIVGIMNAYNMSDGLNGICASFGLIPLVFIGFAGPVHYGTIILMGALLGFLAYNLGWLGKKRRAFLGDSGSNSIGFAIAVLCIYYSQGYSSSGYVINPVTALWLVAIPLLDCIGVMTSRAIKGVMPFRPGRDHFHHKLLDYGLSAKKILIIYIALTIVLCSFGMLLNQLYPNKEYISFAAFIIFSIMFYVLTRKKNNNV